MKVLEVSTFIWLKLPLLGLPLLERPHVVWLFISFSSIAACGGSVLLQISPPVISVPWCKYHSHSASTFMSSSIHPWVMWPPAYTTFLFGCQADIALTCSTLKLNIHLFKISLGLLQPLSSYELQLCPSSCWDTNRIFLRQECCCKSEISLSHTVGTNLLCHGYIERPCLKIPSKTKQTKKP